jgi:hypothetical protein
MLLIGLLIGIFLGANVGILVWSMCVSAKEGDKNIKLLMNDRRS